MKRNIGITPYLFILSLLAMGCTDTEVTGISGGTELDENGLATVTLSVTVADAVGHTRGDDTETMILSTGSQIDMLIYAVYDVTEEGKDIILPYYQANYGTDTVAGQGDNFSRIKRQPKSIPEGQTWVGYRATDLYKIILKIDPERKYKVAFWAQNSLCDAYDTSDLTKVMVSYTKSTNNNTLYPNNDESRDAFSAVSKALSIDSKREQDIILHRPFAQINIGTTGADYANLIYYEGMVPTGTTITQSTVTITGAANRYNVLTEWADAYDVESQTVITDGSMAVKYEWANLPSWYNLDSEINNGLPSRDGFEYEKDYDEESQKEIDNRDEDPFVKLSPEGNSNKEEFLKVSLNGTKDENGNTIYKDYVSDYATVEYESTTDDQGNQTIDRTKVKKYLTETFKYLSMCYVLVPTTNIENGEPKGTTVTLSFNLQQNMGEDSKTPKIELTERTLYNVPAQANYRTNILAGLNDEPTDPTSIFNFYQLPLILNEEIGTYSNSRYYTANLKITRAEGDGLEIRKKDINEISGEEKITDISLKQNTEFESLPIFFTGKKTELLLTVNSGYQIVIDNPKDYETGWEYGPLVKDEQKGTSTLTLIIYPEATAGIFNIKISLKGPDGEEVEEPTGD